MVAALVVLAMVGVLIVLWQWIDGLALADVEKKAAAQLDAVKVAASIAVGGGGLFALYLAARRQRTQELELDARHAELRHREAELAQRDRVQAHQEHISEINRVHAERVAAASEQDAADRRITELYSKSVEQLGSDKAPVRLGGLYALERLAQDNPDQRPTVVNVLCAYLRMPYIPPSNEPADDADESTASRHAERVQERQVRLTAQRILAGHLHPGDDSDHRSAAYWPNVDLDLTGAMLIELNLEHCRLSGARFSQATFIGYSNFQHATFTKGTSFDDATFTEEATFYGAEFAEEAVFDGTTFAGGAIFHQATFADIAYFANTTFALAYFRGATFATSAMFRNATFALAEFMEVTFTGSADFTRSTFSERAVFAKATFARRGNFANATFNRSINLVDALAAPVGQSAWPSGWQLDEVGEAVESEGKILYRFVYSEGEFAVVPPTQESN